MMDSDIKNNLIELATNAYKNSYAPYSKFYVGAALLTELGGTYTGCNVENVSYGLTICAERNAIFQAIAKEGRSTKIKIIVIANEKPCSPCGACRQVIAEFCTSDTIIIYRSDKGYAEKTLAELLPDSFNLDL